MTDRTTTPTTTTNTHGASCVQTRREERGYLWLTVQLTRDGQHPLSSHGYFSVVVHQPEAL